MINNKSIEEIRFELTNNKYWVRFPDTSYDEEGALEEVFHDDFIEDYKFLDNDTDFTIWESPYGDRFWLESERVTYMFYVYEFHDWYRKKQIVTFIGHEYNVEINLKEYTIKKYGTR